MKILHAFALVTAAFLATQPASAAQHGGSAPHLAPGARSGVVGGEQLQRSVPPQLNAPGSPLTLPQSGNPVNQLSPLGGAGQPDSLGIK